MRINALAIAVAMTVAACGGSSDGGGLAGPVSPQSDLSIDSGNGQDVARASFLAATRSIDLAGLVGNSGVVAGSGAGISKPAAPGTIAKPVRVAISSVPFGPETLPCDVSGSITVSGDLANPTTLSAGDVINIDADNCDDGLGEVIDGEINFSVDAFNGDIFSSLYDMTMSMDISNFQVTTTADVVMSNGDTTVRLNTLTTPAVSASVSGLSLTIDSNSSLESLTNYASNQTIDGGVTPSPFTMDSSGTLDTSQLTGVVNYSTPVVFQGFDSDYPSSGELLVSGANSSARLIAVDNVNVRVEIDIDGDGMVDDTIDTTWDELLN